MPNLPSKPIVGQFPSDYAFNPNIDTSVLKSTGADTRGDGSFGFHDQNEGGLFDQVSSLPDLATGLKPSDVVNPYTELEDVHLVTEREVDECELIVRGLKMNADKSNAREVRDTALADEWLRQYGKK